jgi:hypothetical protein
MLDRFQPVAWMIDTPDGWLSHQELLARQHRAELRLADDRPSVVSRLVARARQMTTREPVTADPACACA